MDLEPRLYHTHSQGNILVLLYHVIPVWIPFTKHEGIKHHILIVPELS